MLRHMEHPCRFPDICYLTIHDRVSIVPNISAMPPSACTWTDNRLLGDGHTIPMDRRSFAMNRSIAYPHNMHKQNGAFAHEHSTPYAL